MLGNQLVTSPLSRECKSNRDSEGAKSYVRALELFYHSLDAKEGIGNRYKRETRAAVQEVGRSVLGKSYTKCWVLKTHLPKSGRKSLLRRLQIVQLVRQMCFHKTLDRPVRKAHFSWISFKHRA